MTKPGVYFGMPEDEYHAIDAVGSSALRDMLIDPLTCWTRHVNPLRKKAKDTEAQQLGRAYHALLLEGEAALRERFYPELDKSSAIGWHTDELRALAESHGIKPGRSKLETALRLSAVIPEAQLAPLAELEYAERNEGRQKISTEQWQQLELAARVMEESGIAASFKGGAAEVSIVTVDEKTGLKCKARIDYLKPAAALDLKTFANKVGKELSKAVADAFIFNRYHVQAFHYWRQIEQAKKRGLPFTYSSNPAGELGIAGQLYRDQPHDFFVVFRQTGDVPNVVVRRFSQRSGGELNAYWRTAEFEADLALAEYARHLKTFGKERPWTSGAKIEDFHDEDFPTYMIDR